jgi:AcrR family transcriptional regulator
MNAPLVKTRSEDTRARIMDTAEALFRRVGYAKTAVADIASELRMSPANVYRFFPSKTELDEKAWAVARSKASASERLERLQLEILSYHKDNLLEEQRVNDMVMVAMEESWDAIMAHKERIRSVLEMILRDGIDTGEYEPVDPRETSMNFFKACVGFCHPVLIAQGLQEGRDLEAETRTLTHFLLRAITPRK